MGEGIYVIDGWFPSNFVCTNFLVSEEENMFTEWFTLVSDVHYVAMEKVWIRNNSSRKKNYFLLCWITEACQLVGFNIIMSIQ